MPSPPDRTKAIREGWTRLAQLAKRRPVRRQMLMAALQGRFLLFPDIAVAVAAEQGGPMGACLADLLEASPDAGLADRLRRLIPVYTVALRELAVTVLILLIEHRRKAGAADAEDMAQLYHDFSNRLAARGDTAAALAAAREAVTWFRRAVNGDVTVAPSEAGALVTLGLRLEEAGDAGAAMAAHDEALAILRHCGEDAAAELAIALSNHATLLHAGGRQAEATGIVEEACQLLRRLPLPRTREQRNALAAALGTWAVIRSDDDDRAGALALSEEALAIRRDLADEAPDAFVAGLIHTLSSYAVHLYRAGRIGEALDVATEATDRSRDLAAARRTEFAHLLAETFANQAVILDALGRREEALARLEEATTLFRDLSTREPDRFAGRLATVVHDRAVILEALDRPAAVVSTAEEAAAILTANLSPVQDALRATILITWSNGLRGVGREGEALEKAGEAAVILRQIEEERPGPHRFRLAALLNNVSGLYAALGRTGEALATAQEAAALARSLWRSNPPAYRPLLAQTTETLGTRLAAAGDGRAALATARQAAALFRRLVREAPRDPLRQDLARALGNLSLRYEDAGHSDKALAVARVGLDIRADLFARSPEPIRLDYALALNNLAALLFDQGRDDEALKANRSALEVLRPRFLINPTGTERPMRAVLNNHFLLLRQKRLSPDPEVIAPIVAAFKSLAPPGPLADA